MKQILKITGGIAGILLILAVTGCAPKGGTLTLVNESSYVLNTPQISLGDSSAAQLVPGEWIKASVEKNVSATVKFTLSNGENLVTVVNRSGNWAYLSHQWSSGLVPVHDGDSVTITVRNKINP